MICVLKKVFVYGNEIVKNMTQLKHTNRNKQKQFLSSIINILNKKERYIKFSLKLRVFH